MVLPCKTCWLFILFFFWKRNTLPPNSTPHNHSLNHLTHRSNTNISTLHPNCFQSYPKEKIFSRQNQTVTSPYETTAGFTTPLRQLSIEHKHSTHITNSQIIVLVSTTSTIKTTALRGYLDCSGTSSKQWTPPPCPRGLVGLLNTPIHFRPHFHHFLVIWPIPQG